MKKLVGAIAALVTIGLLTACAGAPQPTELEAALDDCGHMSMSDAQTGDEGRSLTLNMRGEDELHGLPFDAIECVLLASGIPDSTMQKMLSTRALDGMQTAEWGTIAATWTYHPDNGLDVILELTEPSR